MPVAIYDANVLYNVNLRNLAVLLAEEGVVGARWTEDILDEVFRSIGVRRPDLAPERLARSRQVLMDALPDAMVSGHRPLVPGLTLPDPADRHVLAAAVRSGAERHRDVQPG